jgi:hypothetical protein
MRRGLLVALLIAGAAAAAASWWPEPPATLSTVPDTPEISRTAETSLSEWPARATMGAPRGQLFAPATAPATAPPKQAAPAAPAEPVAPPMPYRVAGSVVRKGVSKLLLAKGDLVLEVDEGDTLEGGYRVESIGAAGITLVYVPLGVRERLPLSSASAAPRPAQVRWEGPERVKAGTAFTVALRVTSQEPVRASPLQVSFDAELLEPVTVRPGKQFAEGFAYRIGPEGSIAVGASGRARDPGHVAADAELVVFVFKAIRPAAATELKLTSLVLQGAVGKAIAVEPLGAYRASITP